MDHRDHSQRDSKAIIPMFSLWNIKDHCPLCSGACAAALEMNNPLNLLLPYDLDALIRLFFPYGITIPS